jgi:hypothetical protein
MHLARKHRIPVIAVTALGLAAAAGATTMALGSPGPTGPSASQQLAALGAGDQIPVIVVMKNQHPDLTAKSLGVQRKAAAATDQNPLVAHAKSTGAKDVKSFSLVNGFAAKMTPAEAAHLRSDPTVAAVVPDRPITIDNLSKKQKAELAAAAKAGALAAPAATGADGQTPADKVLPGTCPTDPAKPILEPEALQTTQTAFENPATAQAQNLATGKGVKVAWIADGMDIHNPDFQRADGTPVFTDYQDFSGTDPNGTQLGAEAFGDASSIAAQGNTVYDLSKFVTAQHPLPANCNITVRGIAPGASLVGLNVFGAAGLVFNSTVVEAVDYAVNVDNVDVINESLGSNGFPTDGIDPVSLADDAAVAAGVTVVTSTGDAGVTNTVGEPATDPNVISVMASTTLRSQAQIGVGGIRNVATSWADGNTAAFSSAGITDHARVPDLVAPGQDGWAVCTPDLSKFSECTNETGGPSPVIDFGGTSQSAPFTAGAAALVIEAYKSTHNGVRPTPALVKQILTSSATDLGLPANQQGAGQLNTYRAVRMAMSVKDANGAPAPQGDGLLATTGTAGDTQLSLIGNAGSSQSGTVTLTNTSPNTQTVTAHARELLTTVADVKGTKAVDLTDPTLPFFYEGYNKLHRSYVTQQFTLPAGADHLTGRLAWPGVGSPSLIRLMLVGPNGEYEEFSDPQGSTHYSQVDIAHPAGGTWTAYFYANGNASAFKGTLSYDFLAQKYKDIGSVSPAHATLAPGASQKFTVKATLPGDAGDASAAVEFDTQLKGVSTVPLTLRSLISTNNDGGAFTGVFTGGNARGNSPAQTESYNFDVPKGKKNLDLDLTLANNGTGHSLQAALESPDHQVVSLTANKVLDATGAPTVTSALQGYVDAPAAGRWTLFLYDTNPVAGDTLGQKFTGHIKYNQVDVKASGLPKGNVAAGTPITATITVKNNGVAPQWYFADPRLTTAADYVLPVLTGTNATNPLPFPSDGSVVPATYQVPTHTSNLDIEQSSTIAASFDASATTGLPELYGNPHGLTASAVVSSPWVTQGQWSVAATAVGPTNAAVTGSATESMTAHTLAFDKSAVASTGDLWLGGVDPSAPQVKALILQPGQSGTITVVITPTAAKGTTVNGVIYVDDFAPILGTGDELTGIPYSYTVK